MSLDLTLAVNAYMAKGSAAKAAHTDEGLIATSNARWRAFGIFGVVLFITVLTGLGFFWGDIWARATLGKKVMIVAAIPWMSFLVFYFAIIPRNWRLIIAAEGLRERMWTKRYTFTPWHEIAKIEYDAAHNNVVFRKKRGGKIEVSELTNGFEEIKELAAILAAKVEHPAADSELENSRSPH